MHIPVVCFSCGSAIGHIATEYETMLKERIKERLANTGIPPDLINRNMHYIIPDDIQKEILEVLHINKDCCRKCLTTYVDIRAYY